MSAGVKILLKNIFSSGVIQIANYVFPIITIPIVSRIIGPDKFGTINFLASFVAYFTLLIGFGFDLTATRRISSDPDNHQKRNEVFSEVFTSQCFLLILSACIFCICLVFVPQVSVEKDVAIYTFLTCFATVMTQNWLFQAMQDLQKVAILSLISKIIFTIIILLTIKEKTDYYWQPLALSLSQIVVGIISFTWSIKKYHLKLYKVSLVNCFRLLWEEKLFFFSLCLAALYSNTAIVLLGIFRPAEEVGYYAAGQKIIIILLSVLNIPLSQAFYPYIGKAFSESKEKGINIVRKLFPLVFTIMFLCGILILIFAPFLIKIIYGNKFSDAIIVCRILAFVPMFFSLSTILAVHVMLNLKMDKSFFKVAATGPIIGFLLNFVLLTRNIESASAIAYVSTEIINIILFDYHLRKEGITIITLKSFKNFYSYKNWRQRINYFISKTKLKHESNI